MPFDPNSSSVYGGYTRATRQRVSDRTLKTALEPYKLAPKMFKAGGVYKGLDEAKLRRVAAKLVLRRFQLKKAGKKTPGGLGVMGDASFRKYLAGK